MGLDRVKAEEHARRILQLAEARDIAGLVAYLQKHLPGEKWDAMVLLYSRSGELRVTMLTGQVTITGRHRPSAEATVADLAAALLE